MKRLITCICLLSMILCLLAGCRRAPDINDTPSNIFPGNGTSTIENVDIKDDCGHEGEKCSR